MLTFELTKDGDELEIHMDADGAKQLMAAIQSAASSGDHQHLKTPEWGGAELTSDKQGADNTLLNHTKVFIWK